MKYLTIILVLLSSFVDAEQIDITSAAALVSTQDKNNSQSIKDAWGSVLSKYTGLTRSSEINRVLNSDLDLSSLIIRSYHERVPDSDGEQFWYHINVDENQLKQIAINYNLSVWPPNRQPVYLWLVEDIEGEPQFVEGDSDIYYWIKKWFAAKGVPLKVMDPLQADGLNFDPQAIKTLSYKPVDYLSELNESPHVLMMTLKRTDRGLSYRAGFTKNDEPLKIRHQQFLSLASGMEDLASFIQGIQASGQRVQATAFSNHTVSVVVNNLDGYDAVSRVSQLLKEHFLISQVDIVQSSGQQLEFRLDIQVQPDVFSNILDGVSFLEFLPIESNNQLSFSYTK